MNEVFAFEVRVAGTEWRRIVNARNAGSAKADYWRDVHESWEGVKYTDIRCRKLGAPITPASFTRTATYRGVPGVRCGTRVQHGNDSGTVVGSNDSANFDVLFDDDSRYPGQTLNVHPSELVYPQWKPMDGE